jgi:GNAT superfamily N-acetyltransferase
MFRNMELADIPSGLSLCRSAKWNQLPRDWEVFLRLAPDGNKVCVDDSGNVIGTVTTIRYKNFSWIGMVLVDPEHQRQGIGLNLMKQALDVLMNEHCVKLDATPAGQQVYIKLGFKNEYQLSRMFTDAIKSQHLISSPQAISLTHEDLEAVGSLDREVFGADRIPVLRWLFDGSPELAFKVYADGQLLGYCFGRPGYRFTQIGPIVARKTEVAKDLLSAVLVRYKYAPVIVDVPHHDPAWKEWISSLGFSELRPFIRMYKGDNASPGFPESQFAILGPEFG